MDSVGQEVAGISDQEDQTALDLRIPAHMRELEHQTRRNANNQPHRQAAKEDKQEHPNTLKKTQDTKRALIRAGLVLLRRLKQHDGDGVVQDRFAEDDGVEFGVDFVGVEDCEDGDGVCGREGGAHAHGFDEGEGEAFEGDAGEEPEDDGEDEGGNEGAGEGEGEDCADVAEEVALGECM